MAILCSLLGIAAAVPGLAQTQAAPSPETAPGATGQHVDSALKPEPAQSETNKADAARPTRPAASTQSTGQISESQLAGLPLNGRSYSQLATLQAGVSDPSASSGSRGVSGGSLTVSGGRSSSNNFLLDGTNIMDSENQLPRSAAGVQLGSDSVLQVQVFSVNYGAEYGRSSGGVLNSITRSGTSEWHGSFFEYFRNSKLDARNFFDGAEAPPFKRNQFGGTISGPLVKDRTYFLGSFEMMRDRLNSTDVSYFPDAAARNGFPDPNGVPRVIVDDRVKPYLALYPLPNDVPVGRDSGIGQNLQPQFLPTDEQFWVVRLDQKISSRDSLFARYTFDDASSQSSQDTYLFKTLNNSRQQYATVVGTHIFSTRTLASFRAGYTRPVLNAETLSAVEIPRERYFLPTAEQFGQILVPGLSNFGPDVTIPKGNIMNSFQYSGDLLLQRGGHTIKTGLEVHRYRWDIFSDWNNGGAWSFNSLDNFLQAGPVGTSITVALPGSDNHHAFRQTLLGTYLQDEYKVNSQLAVNLGLRYEFASEFTDKLNRMVFVPDQQHGTTIQMGRYFNGNPSGRSFAPRLGFSWSPRTAGATLVSGGFGIYYDQIIGYVIGQRKSSAPFYNILVNPNVNAAPYFPDAVRAAGNVPAQVQILDYAHITTPMVLRYSVSLQQRLPGGWRGQATYVGARGNHLFRRYEANQFPLPQTRADGSLYFPPQTGPINPAFGALSVVSTDAQSFYNSLQLSVSKNLSRGFTLQGSYAYSKSVDDSSTGVSGNFGQFALMRTADRGLSDFDIRHRVVVNYFYSLPSLGGRAGGRASRLLAGLLGGWRLGGIVSFRSGTPFSPAVNIRYSGYLFSPTRPNLGPGSSNDPISGTSAGCPAFPHLAGRHLGTPELYFDPCAFDVPPPGTLGNAGRNTIIAADVFSADVSIQKDFLLDAKRRLQFRGELFNFPNHTNFGPVTAGSSVVNTSRAGRLSSLNTTARQVQFALRLSF